MKFTFLLPDATIGGAQKVLIALAKEIEPADDLQFLLLTKRGGLLGSLQCQNSVKFLHDGRKFGLLGIFIAFIRLLKYMMMNRDRVVLSTGTGTNLLACAARVFARGGVRLVVREACSSKNTRITVIAVLKRLLYPYADGLIGVSDGVANELEAITFKQCPVASIPNPIDAHHLEILADLPDQSLERFEHPYLLTVGRLVPQKNTAMLIKAFAEVAQDVPEHLVIIGGGPLEIDLRQKISALHLESRIHLLGEVSNPHPWYKRASAFVLSSDWEGYPNVLIEALAHGLRVISTDCEFGPRQILAGGEFGELVPVGDAKAMAESIRSTLHGGGIVAPWNKESFSPQVVAVRYVEFMRSLAS